MGKNKFDADAEVRNGFECMFAEHSGDPLPEMEDNEALPDGMHIIEPASVGEIIGDSERPYEHN